MGLYMGSIRAVLTFRKRIYSIFLQVLQQSPKKEIMIFSVFKIVTYRRGVFTPSWSHNQVGQYIFNIYVSSESDWLGAAAAEWWRRMRCKKCQELSEVTVGKFPFKGFEKNLEALTGKKCCNNLI
jgi:hypothetical protein